MFIVYEYKDSAKKILYPIASFDSIETRTGRVGNHFTEMHQIVGVKKTIRNVYNPNSERYEVGEYGINIILGEYHKKEDRDDAFEKFINSPGVYKSFPRKSNNGKYDERIFQRAHSD